MNILYNESCNVTMDRKELQNSVNLIIASPPSLKPVDYKQRTITLFNQFNDVLMKNGCVLYKLSYSVTSPDLMWLFAYEVMNNTPFTVVDTIVINKDKIQLNTRSKNRLSNDIDFIIVFTRKSDIRTFTINREEKYGCDTENKRYNPLSNFLSTSVTPKDKSIKDNIPYDILEQLIDIYGKRDCVVYDPYMGVGTTAKCASLNDMKYIGSEVSREKYDYSLSYVHKVLITEKMTKVEVVTSDVDDSFWDR